MTQRLLKQWWSDNKLRWRVFWHIVYCPKGADCEARRIYLWTGRSYESARSRIDKRNRCHPRLMTS